jgi:hypothetical protein
MTVVEVELCADLLERAFPGKLVTVERRYGDRARVEAGEGRAVRYAYL